MYVCMCYVCMYVCMYINNVSSAVPVAARSKACVCGRLPAEIVGSNPSGGMDVWPRCPPQIFVCCKCCVLSGRGLCEELITRPKESYRL